MPCVEVCRKQEEESRQLLGVGGQLFGILEGCNAAVQCYEFFDILTTLLNPCLNLSMSVDEVRAESFGLRLKHFNYSQNRFNKNGVSLV